MQSQSIPICLLCRKPYGPRGCTIRVRTVDGRSYPRVRYGFEQWWSEEDKRVGLPEAVCPDCACLLGQRHHAYCDMEECSHCQRQALCCAEG